MQSEDCQIVLSSAKSSWPCRLGMIAAAAAFTLAVLLGVRNMGAEDMGYHLMYGQHLLQTGHIVQDNSFIYTRFDPAILANPDNLGPGSAYDPATNTYHFINANWLSQPIMALAYSAGGVNGLIVLQATLVACLFGLLLAAMRQAGASWLTTAAGLLLATMASQERFVLRPELFGYVILISQWLLLRPEKFSLRHLIALALLQVVAVNVHSYFLPSIALAGVMLIDPLLRMGWSAWVNHTPIAPPLKARAKWMSAAVAIMICACLVNPWTWRGAIFPIQTLAYLSKHHISNQNSTPGLAAHPWAIIGELASPFYPGQKYLIAIWAFYAMLGLAAVAAVAGAMRRRWDLLLAMAGMLAASLSLRRNIAISAMIVVPCIAAIGHDAWACLTGWRQRRRQEQKAAQPKAKTSAPRQTFTSTWAALATSIALLIVTAGLILWTVTSRLYFSEREYWRFGTGWSRTSMPISAAGWINGHNPTGRVFCDFGISSNLLFLTQPHRDVPLLTNTMAYPPYVMGLLFGLYGGQGDFDAYAAANDVQTVVLTDNNSDAPLMLHLATSQDWAVVDLDVAQTVFLRRAGPNAELAKQAEIHPESFDATGFANTIAATDPVPAFSLNYAAIMCSRLGWRGPAIVLWERCLAAQPDYGEVSVNLGVALEQRGISTFRKMQQAFAAGNKSEGDRLRDEGMADWLRARKLFFEGSESDRSRLQAMNGQVRMDQRIDAFRRGQLGQPKLR